LYLYPPEARWLPILVASYDTHGLLQKRKWNWRQQDAQSHCRRSGGSANFFYIRCNEQVDTWEIKRELDPYCIVNLLPKRRIYNSGIKSRTGRDALSLITNFTKSKTKITLNNQLFVNYKRLLVYNFLLSTGFPVFLFFSLLGNHNRFYSA
jgi:hypothetical protein